MTTSQSVVHRCFQALLFRGCSCLWWTFLQIQIYWLWKSHLLKSLVFKRSTHLTDQGWILVSAPSYNESASKSQARVAAQSRMNQNISTENLCWFITKNKTKWKSLRGKKSLLSPVNCLFSPSHALQLSLAGLTSHSSLTRNPKCLCQKQGQEGQVLPLEWLISLQITAALGGHVKGKGTVGRQAGEIYH